MLQDQNQSKLEQETKSGKSNQKNEDDKPGKIVYQFF